MRPGHDQLTVSEEAKRIFPWYLWCRRRGRQPFFIRLSDIRRRFVRRGGTEVGMAMLHEALTTFVVQHRHGCSGTRLEVGGAAQSTFTRPLVFPGRGCSA